MNWQTDQLLAVLNLAICLGIAWACLCRLNDDVCKRLLRPRARYTLLLTGALASRQTQPKASSSTNTTVTGSGFSWASWKKPSSL